jgi:hypothetical protein
MTIVAPTAVAPRAGSHAAQGRRHRGRRWALATAGFVAFVGVLAGGIAGSPWLRHQLALSFTHRPDIFAELYFASPTSLPSTFETRRPFAIDVGLTNVSSASHSYTVVTSAIRSHHSARQEGSSQMTLKAHASATLALSVLLPQDTTALQVSLIGHPNTMLRLHLTGARRHAG